MTTSQAYSSLRRAQLTYEYLHTNSTTHEFLFGALAELVDNARDASSTRIDIYSDNGLLVECETKCLEVPNESLRGKFLLCFLDDGDGMDPSEVANVVQFGRSVKRQVDSKLIGQYGNGLKSGTMRIGKDMILFTRKAQTMSCLFLSRTFHEKEKIEEVVVPMPSWNAKSKKPLASTRSELEKHSTEVNIILKHSPFKTEGELLDQFAKIGAKGTLVAVYNMKMMDNGEPELDVTSDPRDILMGDPYADGRNEYDMVMPERKSFRAYTAILYLDPRMKIYIQHKKVQTKRLMSCLYKPRCYQFTSKRFKTRSEKDTEKAELAAKLALERARELETQAKEIQERGGQTSKDTRVELRRAQDAAAAARAEASLKTKIADAKKKSLKEPKTLNFTFGFNIEKRACYGAFIYNCSRLIRMYEKVGPQLEGGVKCFGVVGVVDVPYLVLEPTHNKQDFADNKEFKHLTKSLGEHLEQYWKDSPIGSSVAKFWEDFGYVSSKWTDDPSSEQRYSRKRAMQIPLSVQCASCLKWRQLPFSQRNVGREFPEEWCCTMNPDPNHNKCDSPEQKVNIPVGILQKQTKSVEEKSKEMEEQIRKKKEKLELLNKQSKPQRTRTDEPVRKQPQATTADRATAVRHYSSPRSASPVTQQRPSKEATRPASRKTSAQASKEPANRAKQLQVRRTSSADSTDSRAFNKNKTDETRTPAADSTENHSNQKVVKATKRPPAEPAAVAEEEVQPKRRKEEVVQANGQDSDSLADTGEVEWSSDAEPVSSGSPKVPGLTEEPSGLKTGKKVEAKVNGKWYVGTVVTVKAKKGPIDRVRVKFDNYPKDKYDKWFDHPSNELRVLETTVDSPSIRRSPSPSRELPSTTTKDPQPTAKESAARSEQRLLAQSVQSPDNNVSSMTEDTRAVDPAVTDMALILSHPKMALSSISKSTGVEIRRCLCYFAPPSFSLDKDGIKELSVDDLREFSLDKFFDEYEKGLKELIGTYMSGQQAALKEAKETQEKLQRSQNENRQVTTKLRNLRRVCAKLIRSLNEDPEDSGFGVDDDSETVDSMLEAIADQAQTRT